MHGRMPPQGMPPQMMMHVMPGRMRPPFSGPAGPSMMMRPPYGSPGRGMPSPGNSGSFRGGSGALKDYTQEQIAKGVRVDVRPGT